MRTIRPRLESVSVYGDYSLLVSFSNGEQKIFDVRPYLEFTAFRELKNRDNFAKVMIVGSSVGWNMEQDAYPEISPDELYYNSAPCFV